MTQRSRRRQRRRAGVGPKLLLAVGALVVVIAIAAVAVTSWVLNVAADAPSLADCKKVDRVGNSTLYAGDGSKLGAISADEARAPVSIGRIPRSLQLATVAIEDQRFFQHGGVDPEGILRAALKDLEAGKPVEGGSTITQQLVRGLCLRNPHRNLERKIIEAKLAIEYAKHHTRRQILDQYLNTASYGTIEGSTAIGVGAASRFYFSKPVWKLTLPQAALLAGLPQAPSEYNPILHPGAARARRNEVLKKLDKLGFVAHGAAEAALRSGLALHASDSYFAHRQPYFFDYVEDKLIAEYGAKTVRNGGLKVYTTIEPKLQQVGLDAMSSTLPYSTDPASALVSIDPRSGHIETMASSSSYGRSKFNLAAQGHRQPGSTFKAFVLTTAIKQGIDPYTTYYTSKPLDLNLPKWGHWTVHTADLGYQGTVNLQQATVTSDNTVFAQLDLDVGPANVAATAKSMGITSKLDGIPAEGIGGLRIGVSPLEMADAYATLASGGIHRNPIAIRKVVFPNGRVDRPERPDPKRVLSPAVAYRGDALAPRQHHQRHRHRRLHGLRGASGQDRHHRQLHGRLVRRLPAQPRDGGLGRLPPVQQHLDEQRARDDRLRRDLPGGDLALGLLERRGPVRGLQAPVAADRLGAVLRPVHPPGAEQGLRSAEGPGQGHRRGWERGRQLQRLQPERLRTRRRPETGPAAATTTAPTANRCRRRHGSG